MKKFFSIFLLASVAFLLQATVVDQSTALQLVKSLYGERADSVNYYVGSVEKYVNKYYSPVNTDEAASIDWLSGSDEKWLIAVDEQPLLRWGHDCSYFYIPKEVDSSKEIPHFRVKGSLIPHSLKLQCAEKNIALNLPHRAMRLAQASGFKPLESNPAATDTKVIILMGNDGINYWQYDWDMCSQIYQLFTQKYLISKDNINIFASDGGNNLNHDLDFDGSNENVQEATLDNLYNFFKSMSKESVEKKHVFVFYIGGSLVGENYLNAEFTFDDRIPAIYVKEWFREMPNNIFSLLICCSQSEGLQEVIQGENMVITTDNNSIRSDSRTSNAEFLRYWIDAMAGVDRSSGASLGNEADTNLDGKVTMKEAFNYSAYNASYPSYNNPTCVSTPTKLADELAFNNSDLPSRFYSLYIRDNEQDKGDNTSTGLVTWNSPDIWVRNNADGFENQSSQPLNKQDEIYVYVRVNNAGPAEYQHDNKQVDLFWKPKTLGLGNDSLYFSLDSWLGTQPLTTSISPQGSLINEFVCHMPKSLLNSSDIVGDVLPFDLMAIIAPPNETDTFDFPEGTDPVLGPESKNVAVNRMTVIDPTLGKTMVRKNGTQLEPYQRTTLPISIMNPKTGTQSYSIEVMADKPSKDHNAFTNSNIALKVGDDLHNAWIAGGGQSQDVDIDKTDGTAFVLKGTDSKIQNILLPQGKMFDAKLVFDFKMISASEDGEHVFHLLLKDAGGNIVDAESFKYLFKSATGTGTISGPGIVVTNNADEGCALEATNVAPESECQWYDPSASLISEGKKVVLGTDFKTGEYLLATTNKPNGTTEFVTTTLNGTNSILSVSPNPVGNQANVTLALPAKQGSAIRLTSVSQSQPAIELALVPGEKSCILDTSSLTAGAYVVNLLVNGDVADSVQVIKK